MDFDWLWNRYMSHTTPEDYAAQGWDMRRILEDLRAWGGTESELEGRALIDAANVLAAGLEERGLPMHPVDLLPCPFCGGAADLVDDERSDSEGAFTVYLVGCAECDAGLGEYRDYETPEAAAAEWNRRVDDLALAEEVTRLRAKLAELQADNQKLLKEYSERLALLEEARRERDNLGDQAQRAVVRASEYQDAFLACQASRHELREACQAARVWLKLFGEHAPFAFGGEAELDERLRAALGE